MNPRDRRNILFCVSGESLLGAAVWLITPATVLVVLLRTHGATERMIASVYGIEQAGACIPQVLGLYLLTSPLKRKRHLMLTTMLVVVPFLLSMGMLACVADRLPPAVFRWSMLLAFTGWMVGWGSISSVWTEWLARIFHRQVRGTATGLVWGMASLVGTAAALVAGRLLAWSSRPAMYASLHGAAAALIGIAWIVLWRIDDSACQSAGEAPRPNIRVLLARFRESVEDRNFARFLAGRLMAATGLCAIPFVALHYTSSRGGALGDGTVVSMGAAMAIGMGASNILLGCLGDRHGHRLGLLIGIGAQMATLLALLLVPGVAGCFLTYLGVGVCLGSGLVSHYNMLFETCPHDHQAAHITVGSLVVGGGTALASLAAGSIAERWGLPALFAACLCVSALALVWLLFLVKEPRTLAGGALQ